MASALLTNGLTKRFGQLTAVDDLDLEVAEGEVFGFLGPNGAGKTTTIRILLDMLRPTSGAAEVLGGRPGDTSVRARIGFLPADLHLDPSHTVEDALGFLGDLRGGFERAELDALTERFDLDRGRKVGELSTGNRRKVGVIQAFAHRPDLLILDEPTSGLDPLLQRALHDLIQERVNDGATVFLSSHVLPEVERVAHRVGILRSGRLVHVSKTADIRTVARQHLELHLAETVEASAFADVPGVASVEVRGQVVNLVIEGSADAAMKRAATFTVERVLSHDNDLEDAFLDFYR